MNVYCIDYAGDTTIYSMYIFTTPQYFVYEFLLHALFIYNGRKPLHYALWGRS